MNKQHIAVVSSLAQLSAVPEFAGLSAAALGADFLDLQAGIKDVQEARSLGVDTRAQRTAATARLSTNGLGAAPAPAAAKSGPTTSDALSASDASATGSGNPVNPPSPGEAA